MQVEINNQEVTLTFHHEFKGRGGWNIFCKAEFEGKEKTIKLYSRNETFINYVSEMIASNVDFEDIQVHYFLKFHDDIMEDLEVFANDVNSECKTKKFYRKCLIGIKATGLLN